MFLALSQDDRNRIFPCGESFFGSQKFSLIHDTLFKGGEIFVNGKRLNEPWFVETKQSRDFADIEVPEGQVLLLGDNRLNSKDGTCFGPVSVDTIVGRAFFRIWPVGRLGSL